MQPAGVFVIGQDCVYPKAPVPSEQKWKLLPVSSEDQSFIPFPSIKKEENESLNA